MDLRQIGIGLQEYAKQHGGVYPRHLGDLLLGSYVLEPALLVCPASRKEPMRNDYFGGAIPRENLSYVYVYGLVETDPTDSVVLYCEQKAHGSDRTFALTVGQTLICDDLSSLEDLVRRQTDALREQGRDVGVLRPGEFVAEPFF